jgi:hypothetical protein
MTMAASSSGLFSVISDSRRPKETPRIAAECRDTYRRAIRHRGYLERMAQKLIFR